jgi:hypothetical protein
MAPNKFVQFMMDPDEVLALEKQQRQLALETGSTAVIDSARADMASRDTAKKNISSRELLDQLATQMQISAPPEMAPPEDPNVPYMPLSEAPTLQGQRTASDIARLSSLARMRPPELQQMQQTAEMSDNDILAQRGLAPGGQFGETTAAQAFRKDITGDIGQFDAKKQEIATRKNAQGLQDKIEMATMYRDHLSEIDPQLVAVLDYAIAAATPDDQKLLDDVVIKIETTLEKRREEKSPASDKVRTAEQQMRQQYIGLSKDFQQISDAYKRIEVAGSDPSPAGDLALIFNYMKLLDPGSTVRESEFATAENSGGVPDRVRNMWNKMISGERLSVNRADFLDRARMLHNGQLQQQKRINQTYSEIATRNGLNPQNIVLWQESTAAQPLPRQQAGDTTRPMTPSPATPPAAPAAPMAAPATEYDDILSRYLSGGM